MKKVQWNSIYKIQNGLEQSKNEKSPSPPIKQTTHLSHNSKFDGIIM